jgi:hypothetical protein
MGKHKEYVNKGLWGLSDDEISTLWVEENWI